MPTNRVIIVPHTHWDREWYEPVVRFRQRLLPAMDRLIALLERDPGVRCFLLDGQAAMVDDYLETRPDRRAALEKLVRAGRVLVGPWYVLADELLPADETLVRNLLVGRHVGNAIGGWQALGYSPDAFGHPAALPTILAGFGITTAIVWRGYGGETGQSKDLFQWIGPDGASVLVHHLPTAGYELGSALPVDAKGAADRWQTLRRIFQNRAAGAAWLVLNGADHHMPQEDIARAVELLNHAAGGQAVTIGSPAEYFAAVGTPSRLAEVRGELRFSYRYTWTLQGVHSTRARMKQMIAEGEHLLLRWVEPQLALTQVQDDGERRRLLEGAWKDHLRNTAHDSIAGCVADPVARDIMVRAAGVSTQARGLLSDTLHDRLGQDRARARERRDRWTPALVAVNPSARPRGGVLEATVTVYQDDVIVGRPDSRPGRPRVVRAPFVLAPDGTELPMQVLASYEGYERLDSPRHYPDQDRVGAFRVAVQVPDVAAHGVARLDVKSRNGATHARVRHPVAVSETTLSGNGMELAADPGGGFVLKGPDGRFAGLGALESERDHGDTYTFQPVIGDNVLRATWSAPRVVCTGPLVAALARDFVLGDRVRGTMYARLDAGSRLVRLSIDAVNRAGNHRVRLLCPVPGKAPVATAADMAYGPVMRERRDHNRRRYPKEWPVSTAPFHRYVSARGLRAGLTVFARGLYEYELTRDGVIAVTLLRAVGDLSRGDLAARPGHAGWPVLTPMAQELGAYRAELAVTPRGVTRDSTPAAWDEIETLAEEFHAPLAGLMLRYGIDVPEAIAGPELVGEGLAFKALKPRDKGPGVVLRCVNLTLQRREGTWIWPKPVHRAIRARLDESPINDVLLTGEGRRIQFSAGPREVVTMLVEL